MLRDDTKSTQDEDLTVELGIRRYEGGVFHELCDRVVVEDPFTIRFNGKQVATLMSLPSGRRYLGWGFLVCEGLVTSMTEVKRSYTGKHTFSLFTRMEREAKGSPTRLSGCGGGVTFRNLSGRAILYDVTVNLTHMFSAKRILLQVKSFLKTNSLFKVTGGSHAAALCSESTVLFSFEDIGRHNAVQKVIGRVFVEGSDLSDKILIVTGRVSTEMVMDCARVGIPVVVSRSAPTSLAVERASGLGITIVGFARGQRLNLYTFPERIIA